MHDQKGRALKVGDTVLIPAKIVDVQPTADHCNCGVESIYGRKPDGVKERFTAFNTAVLLRANKDDENDLSDLTATA